MTLSKLALAVAILTFAFPLFCTPTLADTLFFDDFQDEDVDAAPAIATVATGLKGDVADIGAGWDILTAPVTVEEDPVNPDPAQAAQLKFAGATSNGKLDGNLTVDSLLDGAVVTFDFHVSGGSGGSDISFRPLFESVLLADFEYQQDGDLIVDDFVTDENQDYLHDDGVESVWFNTVITFTDNLDDTYGVNVITTDIATPANFTDLDYTIAVDSGAVIDAIQFVAQGNSNLNAYIDNVSVEGTASASASTPEPSAAILAALCLLSMCMTRRRRRR